MSKRTASSELNHDNWDEDDKPEDAGTFKQASTEALKGRVFKTARRRGIGPNTQTSTDSSEEPQKNIFSSFTGFNKPDNSTSSSKAVFSFLSSNSNGKNTPVDSALAAEQENKSTIKSSNGMDSSVTSTEPSSKDNLDRDYYRKLKGLNEAVSKWILTHVSSNPFCILTPVFSDYEKHLANIQSIHCKEDINVKKNDNESEESKVDQKEFENIPESEPTSERKADDDNVSSVISEEKPTFSTSIFGSSPNSSSTASATFSFGSSTVTPVGSLLSGFGSKGTSVSNNAPIFSFGAGGSSSPSAGFSFGAGKPFLFGNVSKPEAVECKEDEGGDEEDVPPKPDHKPVSEEGSIYTKRCKMFIKKDSSYSERGVGNLFLKPVEGGRTQLVVRADTSLGNVLLNVLLGPSLPVQKVGKNNVAVVYLPPPQETPLDTKQDEKLEVKPVTALLRVKTSEDADELFEILEKYKKTE